MPKKPKPTTKKPPPDSLPPPAYLSDEASRVWRETVAHLTVRGTVDAADAVVLESFAFAVVRQRRIAAEIEAAPVIDEEGKINALLRVAGSTAATVRSLAHALGLGPLARQRLLPKAPQPRGHGKWDDLP